MLLSEVTKKHVNPDESKCKKIIRKLKVISQVKFDTGGTFIDGSTNYTTF